MTLSSSLGWISRPCSKEILICLAPTVELGEDKDGPVSVCAVAREVTVKEEFTPWEAWFPFTVKVATVLSEVDPHIQGNYYFV